VTVEDFAAKLGAKAAKKAVDSWTPPKLADFPVGSVIGVDQSLAKCGVVWLGRPNPIGNLIVWEARMITTSAVDTGTRDTLLRHDLLHHELYPALRGTRKSYRVAHELPLPIRQRGMKGQRPEASWMAAAAVRSAAWHAGLPLIEVDARHHKKVFCGNANADKKEHHAMLMNWAREEAVMGIEKITNEDLRDAFSIALTALMELSDG
jgi:hypothetical protein